MVVVACCGDVFVFGVCYFCSWCLLFLFLVVVVFVLGGCCFCSWWLLSFVLLGGGGGGGGRVCGHIISVDDDTIHARASMEIVKGL